MVFINRDSIVYEAYIYTLPIDTLYSLFDILQKHSPAILFSEETTHTLVYIGGSRQVVDVAIAPSSIILSPPIDVSLPREPMYYRVYKPFWVKACRIELGKLDKSVKELVGEAIKSIEECGEYTYRVDGLEKLVVKRTSIECGHTVYLKPYHPLVCGLGDTIEYTSELYKTVLEKYLKSIGRYDVLAYYVGVDNKVHEHICIRELDRSVYLEIPAGTSRDYIEKLLIKSFLWINCSRI